MPWPTRKTVVRIFHEAGQHDAADFLEGADEVLTHMRFPLEHWPKLHSTNVVERINREIKLRTRLVSIFPNRKALDRPVGALLLEEHEEWTVARRYISERSMKQATAADEDLEELVPGAGALLAGTAPKSEGREVSEQEAEGQEHAAQDRWLRLRRGGGSVTPP